MGTRHVPCRLPSPEERTSVSGYLRNSNSPSQKRRASVLSAGRRTPDSCSSACRMPRRGSCHKPEEGFLPGLDGIPSQVVPAANSAAHASSGSTPSCVRGVCTLPSYAAVVPRLGQTFRLPYTQPPAIGWRFSHPPLKGASERLTGTAGAPCCAIHRCGWQSAATPPSAYLAAQFAVARRFGASTGHIALERERILRPGKSALPCEPWYQPNRSSGTNGSAQ